MKWRVLLLFLLLFISCRNLSGLRTITVSPSQLGPGSSGMAQVDDHSFLAVYDLKNFEKGYRLGLIKTYSDSIRVFPITVKDWKSDEGIPSDLESIAKIPGRSNEYLIAESGNWQGAFGRIFHIKLRPEKFDVVVKSVTKIPLKNRNDFDLVGDQYEGMVCYGCIRNNCKIILSERGGSEVNPNGILRWGVIDLDNKKFTFSERGEEGIVVKAPGEWADQEKRDLTDLYINNDNELWATASQDRGDSGPFYSVIYQVGKMTMENDSPIEILDSMQVYKAFPGYKIEALSGPSKSAPESRFSFGTEDEIYGGTWRPIE